MQKETIIGIWEEEEVREISDNGGAINNLINSLLFSIIESIACLFLQYYFTSLYNIMRIKYFSLFWDS